MSQQEAFFIAFITLPDLQAFLLSHLLRQMFLVAYVGWRFNFTSFFLPIFPRGYQAGGENSGKIPLGWNVSLHSQAGDCESRGEARGGGGGLSVMTHAMITCHCYVMMESVCTCECEGARGAAAANTRGVGAHLSLPATVAYVDLQVFLVQKEGIWLFKSLISYEPLSFNSDMQSHFPPLLLLCGMWRHCVFKNRHISVWVRHDRVHLILEGKSICASLCVLLFILIIACLCPIIQCCVWKPLNHLMMCFRLLFTCASDEVYRCIRSISHERT